MTDPDDTEQVADDAAEPADTTRSRRPARWALWIAVAVAVVLGGLVVVLAASSPAADRVVDSPLIGRVAPSIDAPTIDGDHVSIDNYRGRWVLVNYFATWCVPCRKEHPDLVRFAQRHEAIGDVAVIGVVYADDYAAVRAFRRTNGGTWPMAKDPDGAISLSWGVTGVPETFLVDPTGVVRARVLGGVTEAGLEDLLTQATGGN